MAELDVRRNAMNFIKTPMLMTVVIVASSLLSSHAEPSIDERRVPLYTVNYYIEPHLLIQKAQLLGITIPEKPDQHLIIDIAKGFGIEFPPEAAAGFYPRRNSSSITVRNSRDNIARLEALLNELFPNRWKRVSSSGK